ncbi:MAG TPA: aldose 1-epimerase family protein [Flavisolibacter sp.]|nr:aldose 1-epimerase family protein [Flavisolibacter sp.]
METLQNNELKILIDEKGAELKSVVHLGHQLEYMWSGDPAYWAKTSPVLFPIVGALKENTYFFEGKSYHLSRHGFAREKTFTVVEKDEQSITLSLSSDNETLAVFPFAFEFSVTYRLEENRLTVSYRVQNEEKKQIYFSVGAHPAFKLPLVGGTSYDDYSLQFEKAETAGRWPISKEGLIETAPTPFLQNENRLPLTKALFQKDAIVLKHLQSGFVRLVSDKTPHGLQFRIEGFPYLGLWAAPNADFLCIEPWCGIADSVDTNQNLPDKEGILALPAAEQFQVAWLAVFF